MMTTKTWNNSIADWYTPDDWSPTGVPAARCRPLAAPRSRRAQDDVQGALSGNRRQLISAREPPPPRPLCKPLRPPAPLVAIPLQVVHDPAQLVLGGPDYDKELLNS
jgi:hypothetical protein